MMDADLEAKSDERPDGPGLAMACDGSPLPTCAPGWTGPACAFPCDGEDCGLTVYCHGDGRTWGLASSGTPLFAADPGLSDQALLALFEAFVVAHPEAVGLASGVSAKDLDLTPAPACRAPAGRLTLLRFEQRYRGFPVYGPDGTVRVTLAPSGAIAFSGAIVDGRQVWANLDAQASEDAARRSILAHAAERSGLPEAELLVDELHRVAVPRVQRIGWAGTVRSGIAHVATIVVDADPAAARRLPILHAERHQAAGLANEVDIGVLAEDPGTDVFGAPEETAGLGELFDGSPLRGSTRGTEVILGTERVVAYDASGAASYGDLNTRPPQASATAAFDAMPGTVAYDVQNHYVRVQSFYAFAHEYMAGVWESLIPTSSFPPGEFAPRVMLWVQPSFDVCDGASYCAQPVPVSGMVGNVADEYEQPLGGPPPFETLGAIAIEVEGAPAHVLAHELGHVVDLFAAPGITYAGLGCGGAPGCMPSCQLDTTDEAPTLAEAVAQLFAIAATSALYPVATSEHCVGLHAISLGGNAAPHNEVCRPGGEEYSRFLDCGSSTCDHDFGPGIDDAGQPTGLCSQSPGYRTDSLHQAFWELFHGESCSSTPPYTCTPITLPPGLSASDAFMPALLYGLRVDAKSYQQFVDAFVTHVSCNLGVDVYEQVNDVLCHHDLRACDVAPPVTCEWCPNGVREGNEPCDGTDFGAETCQSQGFDGGVLACDASCTIDTTMCTAAGTGVDETGATGTPEPEPEATSTETSTTGTDAEGGGGGCGCSTARSSAGLLGSLALFVLGARRRRHVVAGMTAALVAASVQGCCDPMVDVDDEGISGSSEEGGSGSSTDGPGASESTAGAAVPEWAIGGSWVTNVVGETVQGNDFWFGTLWIPTEGELVLDWRSCLDGGLQRFRWTTTDGTRLRLEPESPAAVFAFGGDQVSEVVIELGQAACDPITIRSYDVEAAAEVVVEWRRGGGLCAVVDGYCTFDFFWCAEPPPCE